MLADHFIDGLSGWQKLTIASKYYLQVHPDLELTTASDGKSELVLLGFLFDSDELEADNARILQKILSKTRIPEDIFRQTESLAGRWILIFNNKERTILFNDAAGLRQVFYTTDDKPLFCASQPGIIAEELKLTFDEKIKAELIDKIDKTEVKEYWLPAEISPFAQIKRLLPNHYLDLRKRCVQRYWPTEKLIPLTLRQGAEKNAGIFKSLMAAAHKRYKLGFTITAGWDTRVLLAASKDFCKDIFFFTTTYQHNNINEENRDIKIPAILFAKLGLDRQIIRCPDKMDNDFAEIFNKNVTMAHEVFGAISQGIYENYPQDRLCVRGAISSEIVKPYTIFDAYALVKSYKKNVINSRTLAQLTALRGNEMAIDQFDKWLYEVRGPAERCNYNIIELFEWEQTTASWQATSQLETDIAHDIFIPYNCRKLLQTMHAVSPEYRRPVRQILYTEIIRLLWPQLLTVPINPKPFGVRIKEASIKMVQQNLVNTGLYWPVKDIYYKVKTGKGFF